MGTTSTHLSHKTRVSQIMPNKHTAQKLNNFLTHTHWAKSWGMGNSFTLSTLSEYSFSSSFIITYVSRKIGAKAEKTKNTTITTTTANRQTVVVDVHTQTHTHTHTLMQVYVYGKNYQLSTWAMNTANRVLYNQQQQSASNDNNNNNHDHNNLTTNILSTLRRINRRVLYVKSDGAYTSANNFYTQRQQLQLENGCRML